MQEIIDVPYNSNNFSLNKRIAEIFYQAVLIFKKYFAF
jgi:hypothetical protein